MFNRDFVCPLNTRTKLMAPQEHNLKILKEEDWARVRERKMLVIKLKPKISLMRQ